MTLVLMFICLFVFVLCILLIAFKIPSFKAVKNISTLKEKGRSVKFIIIDYLVSYIGKINLTSEVKKIKLQKALTATNSKLSPNQYVADVIANTLIFIPLVIIGYLINIFIGIILSILTITYALQKSEDIYEEAKKKKDKIDRELLGFCMFISASLKINRDIIYLFDTYKNNNSGFLARELSITISDMRTGNYENALKNLERRIGSVQLSEVVRGLIATIRGDNTVIYFENLIVKYSELERQRLKGIILKKPKKIDQMSLMVFMGFLMIIFSIIITIMSDQISKLFFYV